MLSDRMRSRFGGRIPGFGVPILQVDFGDPEQLAAVKASACVQMYVAAEHFAIGVGFNAAFGFGALGIAGARVLVEQMFQLHHLLGDPASRLKDFLDYERIEELKLWRSKEKYPGRAPYRQLRLPPKKPLEEWWDNNWRRWSNRIPNPDQLPDSWPTVSSYRIAKDTNLLFEYDLCYRFGSNFTHPSPRVYASFRKAGIVPGTTDITSAPFAENIDGALIIALRGYTLFLLRFADEFKLLDPGDSAATTDVDSSID
jgi:hypothetical protein